MRALAFVLAVACAPLSPPARESPEMIEIAMDSYPQIIDPVSGAWWDGYLDGVRRLDGTNVIDVTTATDATPSYVRVFEDGTVWIGPEPRVFEGGAWRSFAPAELGPCSEAFRALSARAPDDVWLAAGGSLCHYDGSAWTGSATPLEIAGLAAAESGLYARDASVEFRPWDRDSFEDIAIPDVPFAISPLDDGRVAISATVLTEGGYEDHVFFARGPELEAIAPARADTIVGASAGDVWAVVRFVETDSGECTFDERWEFLCPGVVHYTQDVVLHLEGGEFREVGHVDHPGYHASEAVPLPGGRLLLAGYDEGWVTAL
jgi:hypothetical protein